MEILKMTREQLISENEDLKLQATELKTSEEQQKKVESALRASEEQFRRFFNTAPVGLSLSNPQVDLVREIIHEKTVVSKPG